jgi:hypothetical protein
MNHLFSVNKKCNSCSEKKNIPNYKEQSIDMNQIINNNIKIIESFKTNFVPKKFTIPVYTNNTRHEFKCRNC